MNRRDFLRGSVLVGGGLLLWRPEMAFSGGGAIFPGIIYTREDPGMWAAKVGSHAPEVKVEGRKVTITTVHPMSERHYIVRHTLVSADGRVLGAKTFYPSDPRPVSTYLVPEGESGRFYATSFCNLHDFWVEEFSL